MNEQNNQEVYVGMYRDDMGECKLDGASASTTMYKAVHKFYDDMTDYGIVGGENADQDSGDQLDDLADSECDMVTVDKSIIDAISKAF